MIDRVGSGFKDYAPFILRMGLAIIFILQGGRAISRMGSSPSVESIVILVVALIGGLFCLIGFLTRWAGCALAILMLYRIIEGPGFKALSDPDYQLLFAAFTMSFAVFGLGGGKWSLDEKMKKKDD
jgi:uncharacterized membrane protein YphA (DoxX/SURF4 family)